MKDYLYEFEYDPIYCYPNSTVLKNKLNIKEADALCEAEREITAMRIAQASMNPIQGKYDTAHLKRIHHFLFGDIYAWAGKTRTVNISKGTPFCLHQFIDTNLDALFLQLKSEKYLAEYEAVETLARRLSYYLAGVNAIHPFREGNGRSQRLFISMLSNARGYDLNFDLITTEEMLEAGMLSFRNDYRLLDSLMMRIIEKSEE